MFLECTQDRVRGHTSDSSFNILRNAVGSLPYIIDTITGLCISDRKRALDLLVWIIMTLDLNY
jgi:hypothetical protein